MGSNDDDGDDNLQLGLVESARRLMLNDDLSTGNCHEFPIEQPDASEKNQDEDFMHDNHRQSISSFVNTEHRPSKNKRHGARNQHKMKYFVQWIHETFLYDSNIDMAQQQQQVSSSSAVDIMKHHNHHQILDVAGGKGELSARLVMCCKNINVTMVDPRLADIVSIYHNWIVPKLPKKWQHQYETKSFDNPNFILDILNERYVQLQMYFTTESVETDDTLKNAIEKCTLMIGMHADSATECIVDTALQYSKPFVVVPCCVFPNLFQQRFLYPSSDETTTTGTIFPNTKIPVRTYEQFCDYLHQKDVRFQRTVLPFDGRNIAIWWDGKK